MLATSLLNPHKWVDNYADYLYSYAITRLRDEEQARDLVQEEQEDFFYEDGHWREEHWPREFGVEGHDLLHNKEFNRVLQNCMQKLPALWLAVFTMKHMEDEATETICAELKVSSANFWVIIHRTKLNLRACLQKTWL